MLNRIACNICKRWLLLDIISAEYYECYVYGLEIIILSLFGFVNVLFVGILTNTVLNAVIFLLCFIIVRQFTGGYHADSNLKCNLYLLFFYLINIYISYKFIMHFKIFFIVAFFPGLFIIYKLGPIEHRNKRLRQKNKHKNKNIAMLFYLTGCLTSLLLIKLNLNIAITINITMIEIIILIIAGKLKLCKKESVQHKN